MKKITELFAFIAIQRNGDEGIVATNVKGSWLPLISTCLENLDEHIEAARGVAVDCDATIKVGRFKLAEVICHPLDEEGASDHL